MGVCLSGVRGEDELAAGCLSREGVRAGWISAQLFCRSPLSAHCGQGPPRAGQPDGTDSLLCALTHQG